MRIRLLKRHVNTFGDYAIGTILNLTNSYANRLICEGKAKKYTGSYPPTEKMKTELFKPKENGNN